MNTTTATAARVSRHDVDHAIGLLQQLRNELPARPFDERRADVERLLRTWPEPAVRRADR